MTYVGGRAMSGGHHIKIGVLLDVVPRILCNVFCLLG